MPNSGSNTDLLVLLDSFKNQARENDIKLSQPVSIDEIRRFEEINKFKLPPDLYEYINRGYGFSDDEILGLARLWSFEKLIRMTELIEPGKYLTNDIKEAWANDALYSPDTTENKIFSDKLQWQIDDAESYFIFGDYNVNSCYWAIKLTNNDANNNEIICIANWVNSYSVVASSFSNFLVNFISEGPESMI